MKRKMRGRPLYFGRNLETARRVALSPDRLVEHTLIVGGTGSGKTVCLESLARQIIDNHEALIFLDPKGTVYNRLVNYCRRRGITDRLYLIDPNDSRYRVGLNYFDSPTMSTTKVVGLVLEAIKRVMGQPETELAPTFERWGSAALSLLANAKLTMAEFHDVLVDPAVRHAALSLTQDPFLKKEWAYFAGAELREQDRYLQSSVNRAAIFSKDQTLREMIGLPTAVDWQHVMSSGGIVLANLAAREGTEELSRFLGIMLIHQIYHAGFARPKKDWETPCYVIADEFADLVCSDFKEALQKLREFGVCLILALQNISDLRGIDPNNKDAMLNSVIQNTETKFILKTRNPDDALFLARTIFGPSITGDEVKDWRRSAVPFVEEREVRTQTRSRGSNSAGARVEGSSSGHSESEREGVELLGRRTITVMEGSNQSRLDSWALSESESETVGRQQAIRYEYDRVPNYRPLEESFHRAAASLMQLERGNGYLLYTSSRPPIKIRTRLPDELYADEQLLEQYTATTLMRMGALPPAAARLLIEQRRTKLLELDRPKLTPVRPEHQSRSPRARQPKAKGAQPS